ncbi:hypothetical protein FRB99_008564 [Tulasnella sp. 403]|nr:hypothetical protein FRB99_008564 [Tulasnella sp. 403]
MIDLKIFELGKLHIFHIAVTVLSSIAASGYAPNLKPLQPDDSIFRFDLFELDYARMHRIAVPVVLLSSLTAISSFVVFLSNAIQRKSLPLIFELTWATIAFIFQLTSTVLIARAEPRYMSIFTDQSQYWSVDNVLELADPVQSMLINWNTAIITESTVTGFLGIHLFWHLVVSIRHIRVRPRVFLEPTPAAYPWRLKSDTPSSDPASAYMFAGYGWT